MHGEQVRRDSRDVLDLPGLDNADCGDDTELEDEDAAALL